MKYTLENTIDATHFFNDNSQGQFANFLAGGHKILNKYIRDWSENMNFSRNPGDYHFELWRPRNETKEHWTTNGVTKYAQPIKTPRKHAVMAAEFMSDDRIKCEMQREGGAWRQPNCPSA